MSGYVVPVAKEPGWTSHDAVDRLRRGLGVREIGHAGTLDPFATGLLLCGVGRGTKILSYLTDLQKEYAGRMRLGRVTDTGDPTGQVVEERSVGRVDLETARSLAGDFVGRREQVPPMVSAVRVGGRRLYELARAGIEVERKSRPIEVHSFQIDTVEGDCLSFRIVCGKGTYVRGLAAEFGEALGTGASLDSLRREAIGPFRIDQAISLAGEPNEIQAACAGAAIPLADALAHLPALRLGSEWVRRVRQGAQPPWRAIETRPIPEAPRYRLLGPAGELIAVASLDAIPGPADRSWLDSWTLRLDRVL